MSPTLRPTVRPAMRRTASAIGAVVRWVAARAGTLVRHVALRRRGSVLTEGVSVRVAADTWGQVMEHYFGDGASHGGVLLCGIAGSADSTGSADGTGRDLRLLVRSFVPAVDGRDYGPGRYGHHALRAGFVRGVVKQAAADGLVPLFVHAHGGNGSVAFSNVDLESHARGYPALMDMSGSSVGALVLARDAAAGELWQPDRTRLIIDKVVVIGTTTTVVRANTTLGSSAGARAAAGQPIEHDRQARVFGAAGQAILSHARVVVVGAGGAGMLAVEYLARLGVGQIVVIDRDKVELSNLSRLPGARRRDAMPWLTNAARTAWMRSLGQRLATRKVRVAQRLVRQTGLGSTVVPVRAMIQEPGAAAHLRDADFIVLAADSAYARYLVNLAAHQYLIPVVQLGAKVPVTNDGTVGRLFAVVRIVLPYAGCLRCAEVIDPTKLALETLPTYQRGLADYGSGEPAPSVITLNAVAVSHALSFLLFNLTGLAGDDVATSQRFLLRTNETRVGRSARDPQCTVCGSTGVRGLGDLRPLPTL